MKYILAAALCLVAAGCSDCTYHRPVRGQIANIGSRYKGGAEGTGSEKIALRLAPYETEAFVKSAAAGEDGLYVECLSTRCAALEKGQCVSLTCSYENHILEPDVIQCKMEKTISCDRFTK